MCSKQVRNIENYFSLAIKFEAYVCKRGAELNIVTNVKRDQYNRSVGGSKTLP